MEIKSIKSSPRRRRGNRPSGGGNRNNGNRNRQNGGSNRNNRNRSRNRSRGGGGGGGGGGNRNRNGGNRSRRKPEPKQSGLQKFLSTITFGLFGKPKKKKRPVRKTEDSSMKIPEVAQPKSKPAKSRPPREEVTSGRLYVGNLDYDANEQQLEELFNGVGNVLSAEVVTNARTQQSKGFAFVEMGSVDEAKRAVKILDTEDFMGRELIVSGARSEGPRDEDADEPAMAESSSEQS